MHPQTGRKTRVKIPEEVLVAKNPFISDSNLIALYGGIDVKVLSDQIHIEADLIGSAFFYAKSLGGVQSGSRREVSCRRINCGKIRVYSPSGSG